MYNGVESRLLEPCAESAQAHVCVPKPAVLPQSGYAHAALEPPARDLLRGISGNCLVLPRGCFGNAMDWMRENRVSVELHDERRGGRCIRASFNGELREEQNAAFEALSVHDAGVLFETTAFGKIVIGAALITKRRVSTLILVHRAQLMEQWNGRLERFLSVDEVLPLWVTRRGRQKKRKIIGCYGANGDTRSGIIDIAMLQYMGNADEIRPWIHDVPRRHSLSGGRKAAGGKASLCASHDSALYRNALSFG